MTTAKIPTKKIIDLVMLLGAKVEFKTLGQEVTSVSNFEINDYLLRKLDTSKMANALCDKALTALLHKSEEPTTFSYIGNNLWMLRNPDATEVSIRTIELCNLLDALVGMHSTKHLSSNYETVQSALKAMVDGEEMFYAYNSKQCLIFNVTNNKHIKIDFQDSSLTYFNFNDKDLATALKG